MKNSSSSRRVFLGRAALASGILAFPSFLRAADPAEAARARVEAALPDRAPASPRKPRRLLIFELNVNYGGHASIPTASLAFTQMGRKTGAFEAVVSRDPQAFRPENLATFDAVFFNNNVGNLFEDVALRQSLVDFVYGGGGLMGVHGTTVAFTKWPGAVEDFPEFGLMIGARGANHRINTERVVVKLDDPGHPINAAFGGKSFEYRDEFFRPQAPYSRRRLRVLLSFDTEKTDLNQGTGYGQFTRPDNDYAIAWAGQYGRGRTFYCTIAHHPGVFEDPLMLRFYLAAAQFVLGDLPGSTLPSAVETPALRALEKLGWRLGLAPAGGDPVLAGVEACAKHGLRYLGAYLGQPLDGNAMDALAPAASPVARRQLRLKLDAAGVRIPLGLCGQRTTEMLGSSEAAWAEQFAFARAMGLETLAADASASDLPMVERLCARHDMQVALTSLRQKRGVLRQSPAQLLKACRGRSAQLGIYADLEGLLGGSRALRAVRERLLAVRIPSRGVAWEELQAVLPIRPQQPVMLCLAPGDNLPQWIEQIQRTALAKAG